LDTSYNLTTNGGGADNMFELGMNIEALDLFGNTIPKQSKLD